MNPQFQIESQYKKYLEHAGLNEDKMTIQQNVETKRAFFGAFGQALLMFRDDLFGMESSTGLEATMNDMLEQVKDFWGGETKVSEAEAKNKKLLLLASLSLTDLQTIKDYAAMVAGNCNAWLKHVTATDLTIPQVLPSQKEMDDTKAALAEAELIYKQAATEFNFRIRQLFK